MKNQNLPTRFFVMLVLIAWMTSVAAVVDYNRQDRIDSPSTMSLAVIGPCPLFPADNYWNTPITNLPVHPSSAAWVNTIGSNRGFHMDFGSGTWDGGPIGIPFNLVQGSLTTKYTVDFYYPDESDDGPYPIPSNPAIEYGSDHHLIVVDTEDCTLYEIYDAEFSGGGWSAGSGAIWDLNSNALRPDGWTSADAAGLPILPGLVRYEEVQAGVIEHALRFTTNCTADYYLWPARHVAKSGSCANPVPFGARFRLKSSYDISGFSPHAQVILQAMKTYGIVLADNGSPWYVSGAPNENWDNDVLHELDVLRGSNFEAVDTSNMTPWTFADVPDTYWAYDYIERLYNAGITGGCTTMPLNYCPEGQVTRAQMAVFLERGLHYPATFTAPDVAPTFNDTVGHWAEDWIEALKNDGITAGCAAGLYCPENPVTRSQMAVFLLKAKYGKNYTPPLVGASTGFNDVPTSHWAAAWIKQLAAEQITGGCGDGNYCPESPVTRAQMAVFLVKTFGLP